jgi:hypothetical protein
MNPRLPALLRLSFIAIPLLLWGAGCASRSPAPGAPVEVDVEVREYQVSMSPMALPVNTPLRFVITNHGSIAHQVMLEAAGAINRPHQMYGQDTVLVTIEAGQTETVLWVIDQPGEYQLACHIPGHYEGGMVQTFAVNPTGVAGLLGLGSTWLIFGVALTVLAVITSLSVLHRSIQVPLPIEQAE